MNNSLLTQILVMAVLIIFSAYFSATETAFSSLSTTRLKTLAEKGSRKARLACELSESYDKLLSTILIGNNIVNIALASIGTVLFVRIYGDIGATISTVVITVLVLIFGEISPKTMAKESPERFAMFSAPIMRVIIVILTPLNYPFTLWKRLLDRIFRLREDRKMTQDELLMLVDEVTQDGSLDEDEGELLYRAISFGDRVAEDILTPRVDLTALPVTAEKEEIAQAFCESRFSRLLFYRNSVDDIVGVLHQKDFYTGMGVTRRDTTEVMTEPIFVPPTLGISDLLELLQKNKAHIAVVSDEYGGTLGIVTMEDILEELVGEIWDEHDEVIESFCKTGENSWKIACSTDLDRMFRYFDIDPETESTTISGWVMEELGHIPQVGDSFEHEDCTVTVTDTDSRRVLEIEIEKLKPEE